MHRYISHTIQTFTFNTIAIKIYMLESQTIQRGVSTAVHIWSPLSLTPCIKVSFSILTRQ